MSRRALTVVASCLLALGALVALAGATVLVAFGGSDGLHTGPHPVATPARALVSSVAEIDHAGSTRSQLGKAVIDVSATTRDAAHGAFVGIAPAAAVDRYLARTEVDVVTDFEVTPFQLTTQRRPGSETVAPPASQDFWVARAETRSGTARLTWTVREGDYRVVFMNADATPAIDVDAVFGITVPGARPLALTLIGAGLVLVAGGVVALVVRGRTQVHPRTPRPPTGPQQRETLPTGPSQRSGGSSS